jgi:hypothetical protein
MDLGERPEESLFMKTWAMKTRSRMKLNGEYPQETMALMQKEGPKIPPML